MRALVCDTAHSIKAGLNTPDDRDSAGSRLASAIVPGSSLFYSRAQDQDGIQEAQ